MSTNMTLQSTYTAFPTIAMAGQLEGSDNPEIVTLLNATTAAVSVPFGTPVKYKASPATDKDSDLLSANTDIVAGIVVHTDAYARVWTDSNGVVHGDLDSVGLIPGVFMNVLRRGKIALACVSTTAVGNPLHTSFNATGATFLAVGQCGGTGEAGHTIKVSQTQFLTSCAAGGFAWLDANFVGCTSTAD